METLFVEKGIELPIGLIIYDLVFVISAILASIYAKEKRDRAFLGVSIIITGVIIGTVIGTVKPEYHYIRINDDSGYEQLINEYEIVNRYDNKLYKCIRKDSN